MANPTGTSDTFTAYVNPSSLPIQAYVCAESGAADSPKACVPLN
jgi:hypothetical protein